MPHDPSQPLALAVLISGGGTTLRNLIAQITSGKLAARIRIVISSNPHAPGLEIARAAGLAARVVRREDYATTGEFSRPIFEACRAADVQLVACGGFLKLLEIPPDFENKVINIHPALIPLFCGKGYFGLRVHRAVLEHGLKVSGCTVHFVDNEYDHGPIILQRCVPVWENDTAEVLAARVFQAECEAYPEAIRLFAAGRLKVEGRRVRVLPE